MSNLDLLGRNEKDVDEIFDICEAFMAGKKDMFPLKKRGIKQSNEQIWKQLTAYLNENYGDEDSDLVLYR